MRVNPVEHKFGKPKPYPVTFGIYKNTTITGYGKKIIGEWGTKRLEIYTAKENGQLKHKLYCLYDLGKWIKSKLVYYMNGIKDKTVRSSTGC